jgi:hypothetical protein
VIKEENKPRSSFLFFLNNIIPIANEIKEMRIETVPNSVEKFILALLEGQ